MDLTAGASVGEGSGHQSHRRLLRLEGLAPQLLFAILVAINCIRLYRHAMWRDELQAFMLAAASSTPLELFANLKYEGHPGLWHLLLWVITRFTSDPIWMQVAHLLIALGIWALIWRASPFKPFEKLLLLLSYYLFWEYFVLSRNYALGVLLGFGFIALWVHRPEQRFWSFVLLGLLANTSVYAAIWSVGLAALFIFRNRTDWRALLPGAAIYLGLCVLAIATMFPAYDSSMHRPPNLGIGRLNIAVVVGAFVPLFKPFVHDALTFIGAPVKLANALGNPARLLTKFLEASPGWAAVVLTLPILACLSIVRDRWLSASYAIIFIGIMSFSEAWNFEGEPRHYGFLFIALIGVVWIWRARPGTSVSTVWLALLLVNAVGGLTTLSSELRPYSQSRQVANWLEQSQSGDDFVIGSRDSQVSAVAGYLGRPIYYLECECFGTFVKWSKTRISRLGEDEFLVRIARALKTQRKSTAIVIVHQPFDLAAEYPALNLAFERLERFSPAMSDETYVAYRVTKRGPD